MHFLPEPHLQIDRCPHCMVAKPLLELRYQAVTTDHAGYGESGWAFYVCRSCGGGVMQRVVEVVNGVGKTTYPSRPVVAATVPDRPRMYLTQAMETVHAPSGSVMLSASAVDSMLKSKGYMDGSLYTRVDKAAADHVITRDMAQWAHEVRLEANGQRHADDELPPPSTEDAQRCISFATALAEYLFVLPAKIAAGRSSPPS